MSDDKAHEIRKVHCNQCGTTTRHAVVSTRIQRGADKYDERYSINWIRTWKMLECLGCEAIQLEEGFWWQEDPEDETYTYYPPPLARQEPRWASQLPDETHELLSEVYAALQADSRRLAMMGLRALMDIVMRATVGDIGGFATKLSKLETDGFVSRVNREVLNAALDAGSAAAHRGHKVSTEDLEHSMDIVENLLQSTLLPKAAEQLRSRTPRRG